LVSVVIKRIGRGHNMAVQAAAQGNRRSLVKQEQHFSDSRDASGGLFEHRTSLLLRDSGKKINKSARETPSSRF
jgi:hypothetical protein